MAYSSFQPSSSQAVARDKQEAVKAPVFELAVYPNPAHGTLRVELITREPCLLRIVDQQGRISFEQQNYRSHENVDISRLTPGLYIVQAIRPNGDMHVGKVSIR